METAVLTKTPAAHGLKEMEKIKMLLRNLKNKNASSNLYDHIVDCIDKLSVHYPDQALAKFEEISYLLKHTEKDINEFLRMDESTAHAKHCDQKAAATAEFVKAVRKIFARGETTGEEGEEVQEEQAAPVGFVPDII